jgi:hypothetical protein
MKIILIIIVVALGLAGFFYLGKCLLGNSSKKTGLSQNSMTLEEAKKNNVFQYQLSPSQAKFTLPNGKNISIKRAWIESGWSYEKECWCKIGVKKRDYSNLVIEIENYSMKDYDSFLLGDHVKKYFAIRSSANKPDATLLLNVDTSEHYLKFFWYRKMDAEFDTLSFSR